MADFSDSAWDGSASNYSSTEAFCAACLIDLNTSGEQKIQNNCKLPVKTPAGAVNTNALRAAQNALLGARNPVNAPAAEKKKAARAIINYMRQAKIDPADGLKKMAQ